MSNLKSFIPASALLTLLSGVDAGPLVERTQNPPLQSCSSNFDAWTYSGCFTDPSSPRALLFDSGLNTQNMTVETCIAFCKGNDYRYAGLEYYGECFCGASVNGVQVAESQCTFPCTGNSSQTCGGNDLLNIYQDPTFPLVDNTTISDYKPLGCYSESTNGGRALAWRQDQVPTATLTVEACLYACKLGGYDFAGVEYAQECYCGVVIGNGTAKIDDSQCNMPCNGNSSEICGGSGTLDMYVASDLESTEPCNIVSIPSLPSTVTSTTSSSTSSSTFSWTTTTTSSSTSSSTTSPSSSSTSSSSAASSTKPSSTWTSTTSTYSPPASTPSSSKPFTTTTSSSTTTPYVLPTTSPTTARSTTSSTAPTTSISSTLTTSKTSASLCTTTIITSPTPTCEYSCGNWCSAPMPDFSDNPSCSIAANWLGLQIATCFLQAGWPASLQCFDYAGWASDIKGYCTSTCASGKCSRSDCKSKYPPSGPAAPSGTTSTSVYTCAPSTTMISSTTTATTTSIPVPTNTNICTQPSNSRYGYSSSSPVGSINMPCLTCNNLLTDYNAGNIFKLYTSPTSNLCPSYKKTSCVSACQNSCDQQYAACKSTYANSCSSNSIWSILFSGADSYSSAMNKCTQQWNDCYSINNGVSAGTRCGSWNSGWY